MQARQRFSTGTFHALPLLALLLISAAPLWAQEPADKGSLASPQPAESELNTDYGTPVILAGAQFGSFLRPAARIDIWIPDRLSPGDIVFGAAFGRGGYEVSIGVGLDDSDETGHIDVRGVMTKQRDRTMAGVELTPMFRLGPRVWFRSALGVSHVLTAPPGPGSVLHWNVGVLFQLNY